MRVISKKPLREFWEKHQNAKEPLENWFKEASRSHWANLADVRRAYPHCDLYGACYILNISDNKYRLIVKMEFAKQLIFVKHVLTHREYDREAWKNDC